MLLVAYGKGLKMYERVRQFIQRNRAKEIAAVSELRQRTAVLQGHVNAISRVQAVVEFGLDGVILHANENFLKIMGYRAEEIIGKHHRIFAEREYQASQEYLNFWMHLRKGEFSSGEYKRIRKDGRVVWLLASYSPIFNACGELIKIVKFATDVTDEKIRNVEFGGQMTAIHRVQGVVEFDLDGRVLTANGLFLDLMGYALAEVQGRHHSMFVQQGEETSDEYREFWRNLREGRADARVYKRFGKNGKVVWIQASYNPILDPQGKPRKVVKFCTDLTVLINETESARRTAQRVAAESLTMSRSMHEVSDSMERSRQATAKIITTSRSCGDQAASLLRSTDAMAKIVTLIRSVGTEIDLLALNATIEAARAGDAGRGFAVVANEVRILSDRTGEANEEIGREIGTVQQISSRVADSIQRSVEDVRSVEACVATATEALDHQSAVIAGILESWNQTVNALETILHQTHGTGGTSGVGTMSAA